MNFTIKSIRRDTGIPVGFSYKGKSLARLSMPELKVALGDVLGAYLNEKRDNDTHINMAYERVYGAESKLRQINWDKFTKQMNL